MLLDNPKALPDGTEVEVRPLRKTRKQAKAGAKRKQPRRTPAQRYAGFIGSVKDLPPDMSLNLDHYLHGHPKKP